MVHPNAHLKTLVRSELIVECRLHQLKSTGSRDELLSRLLAHMSYPTDDVVDTASPGSVSSPHLFIYIIYIRVPARLRLIAKIKSRT